ncbi:hypothetical protein N7527_011963 [Penicillium freii]|nr:hypothetical protein N7527_011963 [Penicillium freii]
MVYHGLLGVKNRSGNARLTLRSDPVIGRKLQIAYPHRGKYELMILVAVTGIQTLYAYIKDLMFRPR